MSKKATVTVTQNPLHFEDLEPHRFEDLVRQLAYDFRNWSSIEATGRAGSDDGIDIRAWERAGFLSDDEVTAGEESTFPRRENLWVFQCKREKKLGPARVGKIVKEFCATDPVYGYILAAPVNFTKKSYDRFRLEIREKGIEECHMWGKAELEDMLLMPKNDHILFTFFGISHVVRRRTRVSRAKFMVSNKNRLYRMLGNDSGVGSMRASVLIRDIDDSNYPIEGDCSDFATRPHWLEVVATGYHPNGLFVETRRHFAYVDEGRKEYDFSSEADTLPRTAKFFDPEADRIEEDQRARVADCYHHLRLRNQAILIIAGVILWEDMLVIDDKGDATYTCPHIYVDTRCGAALVKESLWTIRQTKREFSLSTQYKRIAVFPKTCPVLKKISHDCTQKVMLDESCQHAPSGLLLDFNGVYDDMKVSRAAINTNLAEYDQPVFIEITSKYKCGVRELLDEPAIHMSQQYIEDQAGRPVVDKDTLVVLEWRRLDQHELT